MASSGEHGVLCFLDRRGHAPARKVVRHAGEGFAP